MAFYLMHFFCLQCNPEWCHPVNSGHSEGCLNNWKCILSTLEAVFCFHFIVLIPTVFLYRSSKTHILEAWKHWSLTSNASSDFISSQMQVMSELFWWFLFLLNKHSRRKGRFISVSLPKNREEETLDASIVPGPDWTDWGGKFTIKIKSYS